MTEQILALARTLGPAGVTETEALEPLCRAARAELEGMLREGVTPEDCGEAFLLGAAWLALAGLAAGEDGGVESFRAGDVSIRHRSGTDAGRAVPLCVSRPGRSWPAISGTTASYSGGCRDEPV